MNLELIGWFVVIFLFGMVIGMIIGMIRMWFYMHKKTPKDIFKRRCIKCNTIMEIKSDNWECPKCKNKEILFSFEKELNKE